MLPTKFQLILSNGFGEQELLMVAMEILYKLSGFKGEDFLEIDQPKTRIAYGDHVCERIRTK